ncbi:MAG TPA: dienelactone hydrolase family protein [Anaeromyxobacter sp.]|nr:dienelactone hydrolase family protein [Anaeromyxobacter sp.]
MLLAVLGMAAAQGGLEPPVAVSFPADGPLELSGRLYRPSGSGPFPAVVLLHGCDGMVASMAQMEKVAATLSGSGYVVLAVDSFGPRGVRTVCDDSMLIKSPDPRERVGDAIAAKRYLSTLASVQSSHVGLIGWAHGGTTALMAWARAAEPSGGAPFAAIAAYYPVCGVMGLDIRASNTPLLIFIGDRDDVVSASGCRSLIENAIQIRRRDLSIEVYPGATHLFDGPPGGEKSVTIGRHSFAFDEAAAQDSRERLLAFLKRTLGQ